MAKKEKNDRRIGAIKHRLRYLAQEMKWTSEKMEKISGDTNNHLFSLHAEELNSASRMIKEWVDEIS